MQNSTSTHQSLGELALPIEAAAGPSFAHDLSRELEAPPVIALYRAPAAPQAQRRPEGEEFFASVAAMF